MVCPLLLAFAAAVAQQPPTGTEALPIPFPAPDSPYVRSQLVGTEKLLGQGDFTGAKRTLASLSLTEVRWTVDTSSLSADEQLTYGAAVTAGIEVWNRALGGAAKFRADMVAPNIVIKIRHGYGNVPQLIQGQETGEVGCESFTREGGGDAPRKLLATIYVDKGADAIPHSMASITHLAGRAIGSFLGLVPFSRAGTGIMAIDSHQGPVITRPSEREVSLVKALLAAEPKIAQAADAKTKLTCDVPELKFDNADINLGVTTLDKIMPVEVTYRNTGKSTLTIEHITGDCKCLAQEFDRDVPPGGTGKIQGKLSPVTMFGATERHMTVASNDPESPIRIITLHIVVMRNLALEPEGAAVSLPFDDEVTHEFLVFSPIGKSFEVKSAEAVPPQCTVKFSKEKRKFAPTRFPNLEDEERDAWAVKVTIPRSIGFGGPFPVRVVVTTDMSGEPTLEYNLALTKGIRVMPNNIHMLATGDPDTDRRVATIEQADKDFTIKGVETDSKDVEASVKEIVPKRRYRIEFTPKKDVAPPGHEVKVIVTTDSERQPKLALSVWLTVKQTEKK